MHFVSGRFKKENKLYGATVVYRIDTLEVLERVDFF